MFNKLSVGEIAGVSVGLSVAGAVVATVAIHKGLKASDETIDKLKDKLSDIRQSMADRVAEKERVEVTLNKLANASLLSPTGSLNDYGAGVGSREALLTIFSQQKSGSGVDIDAIKAKYRK